MVCLFVFSLGLFSVFLYFLFPLFLSSCFAPWCLTILSLHSFFLEAIPSLSFLNAWQLFGYSFCLLYGSIFLVRVPHLPLAFPAPFPMHGEILCLFLSNDSSLNRWNFSWTNSFWECHVGGFKTMFPVGRNFPDDPGFTHEPDQPSLLSLGKSGQVWQPT